MPSLLLRGPQTTVAITPAVLLAPMEGVTDRAFRGEVARLGGIGAAVGEFIRISSSPAALRVCRRDLGTPIGIPVALQLMTPDSEHLAASVVHATNAKAAWIDLNFGCPAAVVFNKCAGSALLAHPERIAAIVRTAAGATGLPVTAKLRAGIASPAHLRELVIACAESGAAAVTLHARLRIHGYHEPATWSWLVEAADALRHCSRPVPLIGNGGVDTAEHIARMRSETGVTAVMVGRAALADPFLFRVAAGGPPASAAEAAAWAVGYLRALGRGGPKAKMLVRWYRAGGLFADREELRWTLLRGPEADILAWFAAQVSPDTVSPQLAARA
ncbi:MAG: tRNA-dihydrouridine synthase family protein [Planctomycetota bacterium]